jgi:beta-phosphoglucomutase-like phosphatase (HAD superfamily)
MCDKCVEIDEKIRRYQNILRSITDQPTIEGAKRLIAELQAQKAVLHPQQEQ